MERYTQFAHFLGKILAKSERSGLYQAIVSHKSMFVEFGTFCNNFTKGILYQVARAIPNLFCVIFSEF